MRRPVLQLCGLIAVMVLVCGCGSKRPIVPSPAPEPGVMSGAAVEGKMVRYERPLSRKWHWLSTHPQRWDLVVFRPTENRDDLRAQRVAALPGETVTFENDEFLVNGEALQLPETLAGVRWSTGGEGVSYPLSLAENEYFLLNDCGGASMDSRQFGSVSRWEIIGRIVNVDE